MCQMMRNKSHTQKFKGLSLRALGSSWGPVIWIMFPGWRKICCIWPLLTLRVRHNALGTPLDFGVNIYLISEDCWNPFAKQSEKLPVLSAIQRKKSSATDSGWYDGAWVSVVDRDAVWRFWQSPIGESQFIPLRFWSKVMPFSENYSTFEKQFLAFYWALIETKHLTMGH